MNICLISTSKVFLGILQISSYLKFKINHINISKLICYKFETQLYTDNELKRIGEFCKNFDLIAISVIDISKNRTIQLVKFLKQHPETKNIPVILGGKSCILNPEQFKNIADYVCKGDGCITLESFVKYLKGEKKLKEIPNLLAKKFETPYKFLEDIDSCPFFDYEPVNNYKLTKGEILKLTKTEDLFFYTENPFIKNKNVLITMSYFGCVYNCIYCSEGIIKKIKLKAGCKNFIQKRSIKNFLDNLYKVIKNSTGIELIFFFDDDFFIRTKEELRYFSKFYKEKINLPFVVYAHPLNVSEVKLQYLIEAGLKTIDIGIQSGCDKTLKFLKRPSKKVNKRALDIIFKNQNQIDEIWIDFIINNPFENEEDEIETINFILNLKGQFLSHNHNLGIFKGTEISDKIKADENYQHEFQDHILCKTSKWTSLILQAMSGICDGKKFGQLTREEIEYYLSLPKEEREKTKKELIEKIKNTDVVKYYLQEKKYYEKI